MTSASRVLWIPRPRPQAEFRLYCLPYAGGGANVFRGWDAVLPEHGELCAVQLPGREWRHAEPPHKRIDTLVESIVEDLRPHLSQTRRFAFFGYSMGAAVCFAVTRRLRDLALPLPTALLVAACRAPSLLRRMPPIHALDDDTFLAAIKRFGGMPQTLLEEPELLQLVLPTLRADFEVLGTFNYEDQPPLDMPLTVYGGTRDPHAARAELAAWRGQTSSQFTLRLFSGGHFFINEVRAQLLATLASDLMALVPSAAAVTSRRGARNGQGVLPA